jgi:hypothetical protein
VKAWRIKLAPHPKAFLERHRNGPADRLLAITTRRRALTIFGQATTGGPGPPGMKRRCHAASRALVRPLVSVWLKAL